ncbi:MAG TPA: GTPase ObgE [Candidatus Saccharimonadales bacterium]|nr:GTPase ObgE [Candidatus Saccharimonadales bacterium]
MFVDKVEVTVKAGDGGDGKVSFRRERFVDRGGPNGGDGGQGGSVVLVASRNENTLANFRHAPKLSAEPGQPGDKSKKRGKSGANLMIKVPVGTVVLDDKGETVADLVKDGQEETIMSGGRGGFGNAHFTSSIRQAPNFAEKGEKCLPQSLTMEIKMIADVGLVGMPNAGKSTLLAAISNARPEIADYPFTTLTPSLGVVDVDSKFSFLMADIPGLIEGASQGKGLGIQFLRHIERTKVLVHIVDVYDDNVSKNYQIIQNELKAYSPILVKRPQVVVLNKIDGYDKAKLDEKLATIKKILPRSAKLMAISALAGTGLGELKNTIKQVIQSARAAEAKKAELSGADIPVIKLDTVPDTWEVTKTKNKYSVNGARIEQFARRTDFDNPDGVARLRDIMKKMGILKELEKKGIKPGNRISIGESYSIEY